MTDGSSYRQLLAPAAIVAAMTCAGHALLVAPSRDRVHQLEQQLADAEAVASPDIDQRRRLNGLARSLREYRERLLPLGEPLPDGAALYARTQRQAATHNVQLVRFQPSELRDAGEGEASIDLTVEISGAFDAVRDMLAETEREHPFASLVEAFVRPGSRGDAEVVAVIRFRLHRFTAPEHAAPGPVLSAGAEQ